jgi:hypothetical protein
MIIPVIGRNKLRPYNDNSMDVIWHDRKWIESDSSKPCGHCFPRRLRSPPNVIQPYFAVRHVTEQAFPIARADSYEIRARLAVIISLEAD